ncbi:MAG: alpha/beta fold hydrolase [Acidobacteriaceae bacterium]
MGTKGEDRFHSTEASPWMRPFVPRRFLSNGHLQTIVGNLWPRTCSLPDPESQLIEVETATSARGASFVLCHCHWQPAEVRSERLTMVIVHGLEGSSSTSYVLGNAAHGWTAGCNVVRMNMRSCGAGEQLSPSIYHAGRSEDVAMVMADLARTHLIRSFALVGYSMGGNLVLKLAGEVGSAPPPYLKAVVGVSSLMDLVASAAALHEPQNRLYETRFLSELLRRFRHKVELYPGLYSAEGLNKIRTMRQFDEQVVARYGGFTGADDYYHRVASSNWAQDITVPTLILQALDDPFIRMIAETRDKLLANNRVRLVETRYGGHCAFLSPEPGDAGFWAERTLLDFLLMTVEG